MKLPVVSGMIDRRLLINYSLSPGAIAPLLPQPFRPQLYRGRAIAGICLIRLAELRPRFVPRILGVGSESAAHRIAVEWDEDGAVKTGVFVPRRDSSSWFNAIFGGRLFPGVHHRASFDVRETENTFDVAVKSFDGQTRIRVEAECATELPPGSVFGTLEAASEFFRGGSLGYSPSASGCVCEGLELRTQEWTMEPLRVTAVQSSFFDDRSAFQEDCIQFDCGLLMRRIPHQWISLEDKPMGLSARPNEGRQNLFANRSGRAWIDAVQMWQDAGL